MKQADDDKSFIYELNAKGSNKYFFKIYSGHDDDGERIDQSHADAIGDSIISAQAKLSACKELVKDTRHKAAAVLTCADEGSVSEYQRGHGQGFVDASDLVIKLLNGT